MSGSGVCVSVHWSRDGCYAADAHARTPMLCAGAPASTSGSGLRVLPRGQALVLGGDLAYPNPSNETYEMRLVRPFEAAMPPPPGVHPGRLVVRKPDLAPPVGRAPAGRLRLPAARLRAALRRRGWGPPWLKS